MDKNTNENMIQYYDKKYNLEIKNTKQPLLEVENKLVLRKNGIEDPDKLDKIYLVP